MLVGKNIKKTLTDEMLSYLLYIMKNTQISGVSLDVFTWRNKCKRVKNKRKIQ